MGKTYISSEKLVQYDNHVNLIICQKSKIEDWIEHFVKNYANDNELGEYQEDLIFNLTNKKEFEKFIHESKSATRPNCIYDEWTGQEYAQEDLYPFNLIGVINYELAWRRPELLSLRNFTLVLDESSLIQNNTAKQTKFIMKLKPSNTILLSGTPCSGKYENLWTQARLLGWDIKKGEYDCTYVNFDQMFLGSRFIKVVSKKNPYKNVDDLKRQLRNHGALFKKTEEVLDLPEQTFIEMKSHVSKAYRQFLKDRVITIGDREYVGENTLTMRLYARMICSIHNNGKLIQLKDLIESTEDRLIIFYNFKDELEKIKSVIPSDRPISVVNGSQRDLKNYELYDNSITIVQFQAGAKGLNLQKANKLIYFSPTEKCEDYMQSKKRIHRIGSTKPCFYYQLVTEKSVEEKIYKALERGEDYTNELFMEELNGS